MWLQNVEGLSLRKWVAHKFDAEIWSEECNDAGIKEQYEAKISNRYAALENVDGNVSSISAIYKFQKNYDSVRTDIRNYCNWIRYTNKN